MWHFPGLPFQHRMKWWNDLPVYWRKPQVFFCKHYESFSCFETCNVFSIFRKRTANLRSLQQVGNITNIVHIWGPAFPREFWIIYRRPGFLAVVLFGSLHPPPPPFPPFLVSKFNARSQILRPRESMVLYKKIIVFASLCSLVDRYDK